MRLCLILACLAGLCACAGAPAKNSGNAVLAVEDEYAAFDGALSDPCTAERIYQDALGGGAFPEVCNASNDEKLLVAYVEGRRLYRQERKLGFLKKKLKHAKFDLNDIAHRRAEVEANLMSAQTSRYKRAALVRQLEALSLEQEAKEKELANIADAYESAKNVLTERHKYNASVISSGVQKSVPVKDASLDQ